jgi:hypothetical protein
VSFCNVLVVRPETVIVEAHEKKAQQAFKEWGFEVIPVPFRNFMPFVGYFHCATCDVRRAGRLAVFVALRCKEKMMGEVLSFMYFILIAIVCF